MPTQIAFDADPKERSTILHTIAHNCDLLEDLGKRLHDLQSRLYHPQPNAIATPKSEGGDNVESLVEVQSTLIAQHIETVAGMMNRLA